ncbi:hypothetical protein [Halomicrococcus sp. NG-SE-24]|uniref:hypothetical protein n=1 Tax=Halomicrococcus sp. NG-SE-24 TaxID=3436928 RepID=UPI003D95A9C6
MVSADTKVRAAFVVLGVVCWYGTMLVTENAAIQWAVLIGVGVIAPTVIAETRLRDG